MRAAAVLPVVMREGSASNGTPLCDWRRVHQRYTPYSSYSKQTGDTIRDHPKSSFLPFVRSHVTHTALHSQCNPTMILCKPVNLYHRPFGFDESFFVVYKLLYLTINRNKWGNDHTLALFFFFLWCHAGGVHMFPYRWHWWESSSTWYPDLETTWQPDKYEQERSPTPQKD